MTIKTRLSKLERGVKGEARIARVFWHEEFVPCPEHARCDLEVATGEHRKDVVHLSFTDGGLSR